MSAIAAGAQSGESPSTAPPSLLAGLDDYQGDPELTGALTSTGSDTLSNLMTLWSESFQRLHPKVHIQVQAPGSSTAPPALAEGTANLGPMSRRMKSNELMAFEERHGYKPMSVRVAMDALAIYVHKDNPLTELQLEQVDALFSVNRRCGYERPLRRWGQLALTGTWQSRPIELYGRNSVSGTYGYFKRVALCSGDFLNSVNEQPGSASVVQSVGSSLGGIGYSGIGYKTASVKALALREDSSAAVLPSASTAKDGSYPLSRYLYIYINRHPAEPIDPVTAAFLKFVLSRQGQEIVLKDGYIPLAARIARREQRRLN
ncbi:MAG: phosphate ABC transporter substrate-binding protein PstS family protein [Pseudomonadaceae bacterium]|nr:phosphate ABC transporter substrate-binding protein PstS family protein [Pseudomonadaceae bacterium]